MKPLKVLKNIIVNISAVFGNTYSYNFILYFFVPPSLQIYSLVVVLIQHFFLALFFGTIPFIRFLAPTQPSSPDRCLCWPGCMFRRELEFLGAVPVPFCWQHLARSPSDVRKSQFCSCRPPASRAVALDK